MDNLQIDWTQVPGWVAFAIIVGKELIVILQKMLPEKQRQEAVRQEAEIASQKFHAERLAKLEERDITAKEQLSAAYTELVSANKSTLDALRRMEGQQTTMLTTLQGQTNALTLLVDRVFPQTVRSRTRKAKQ